MRDDDEGRVKTPPRHEIGSDLSSISVDELDERIALLQGEIERLEAEKTRKQASRDAAAAFFR